MPDLIIDFQNEICLKCGSPARKNYSFCQKCIDALIGPSEALNESSESPETQVLE